MGDKMKKVYVSGKQAILCLVFVFAMGLTVVTVKSQAASNETPGMAIIARRAHNAAVLTRILKGEIPPTIEQYMTFDDLTGQISTYQPGGATTTADNAFFSSAITTNGRTCFTCHQPQNGWEISPPQILSQFLLTRGRSALFQPVDAANCPNSPGVTARFADPRFLTARSQLFKR